MRNKREESFINAVDSMLKGFALSAAAAFFLSAALRGEASWSPVAFAPAVVLGVTAICCILLSFVYFERVFFENERVSARRALIFEFIVAALVVSGAVVAVQDFIRMSLG